jgi:hypothetical protein
MAQQLQPSEKSIWSIVQAIIQVVNGRHNAVGTVTLTPGAALTVVSHPNCSADCCPKLSPLSASAAAENWWISNIENGGFTVHHANSAVADRAFIFDCSGG